MSTPEKKEPTGGASGTGGGGAVADILAKARAAAAAKTAAGGPSAAGGGTAEIIAKAKSAAAASAGSAAAGGAPASAAPKAPAGAGAAAGSGAIQGAPSLATPIRPPVAKPGHAPKGLEETPKTGAAQMRRQFVFASVFGFIGICTASTVRFFFPRVLFEPKTSFKVGHLEEIPLGVTTKFKEAHRIWVVRDTTKLYVILAICTHLGCTPNWMEQEQKFKCPCHGSGYDIEGVNFEGPAPRPMDRCHVAVDAEGEIVVDKAQVYGPLDWNKPGTFLPA